MGFFTCKHPADRLGVASTAPSVQKIDAEFERVTFYLHCYGCGKPVNVSCTSIIGDVGDYLNRGNPTNPGGSI